MSRFQGEDGGFAEEVPLWTDLSPLLSASTGSLERNNFYISTIWLHAGYMELRERLKQTFTTLFGYLDKRQRRITAAVEARSLGHGVTAVAQATWNEPPQYAQGPWRALTQRKPGVPLRRSRKAGAGASLWSSAIREYWKNWTALWTRTRGAIRCRRFDGPARVHVSWPMR